MQGLKPFHYTFLMPIGAFGGMEMQTVKRAADAIRHGEASLFVGRPSSRPTQYAESLRVPVESLKITVEYVDLIAARRLATLMRRHGSHVCVVGTSKCLSIAILARNLFFPRAAVVFYQQLHHSRTKRDPFHNWVYRNLDGAVVLTQKQKDSLVERTVLPRERIAVIPYGIEVDAFDPAEHGRIENRRQFNLPEDGFLVGLVGRIEEQKGHAVAIEAFAKACIPNSALVICGAVQDKVILSRLQGLAEELKVAESIIFLPFTFDVPALMNAFDVSLLPSYSETFGLVVIEAMACGLPVIATNAGGVPEIIRHKENGMLVPPRDIDALAGAMRRLTEDGVLRDKLGTQARQDTIERYDYARQTEKFFDYCRTVYEERQSRRKRS